MKTKTSLTLSRDVLKGIDRLAGTASSRSATIDHILRRYLNERACGASAASDLERINAAAERLNQEAADVLDYQSLD